MLMWRRPIPFVVALLSLAGSARAAADTYSVPSQDNADPSGASCNTAHVCGSLRAAVHAANGHPGSSIQLGAASYKIGHFGADAPNAGALTVSATMTIAGKGPGGGAGTTIEQTDQVSRVLSVGANARVTLSKLELTGGTTPRRRPEAPLRAAASSRGAAAR